MLLFLENKLSDLKTYTHSVDGSQDSCETTEPTNILHHKNRLKQVLDETEALLNSFRPSWKFIKTTLPMKRVFAIIFVNRP